MSDVYDESELIDSDITTTCLVLRRVLCDWILQYWSSQSAVVTCLCDQWWLRGILWFFKVNLWEEKATNFALRHLHLDVC